MWHDSYKLEPFYARLVYIQISCLVFHMFTGISAVYSDSLTCPDVSTAVKLCPDQDISDKINWSHANPMT